MFIFGTKKGETAINLATHLKNCEGGYEIPEEQRDKFIVNYGRLGGETHLNNNLISDKLLQLKILRDKGVNVPSWLEYKYEEQLKVMPRNVFPLLARKYKHSKGKDAIFLKTRKSMLKRKKRVMKRDYFVQYVPKDSEYRVHVLGDDIAGISKKVKCQEENEHHPHVWSRERGWIQEDYEGEHYNTLKELGIKAVKALEYDFGAVDIMLGKDGEFYVLEINSAPRLNARRRRLYAKYFRFKEREWREARRNES